VNNALLKQTVPRRRVLKNWMSRAGGTCSYQPFSSYLFLPYGAFNVFRKKSRLEVVSLNKSRLTMDVIWKRRGVSDVGYAA